MGPGAFQRPSGVRIEIAEGRDAGAPCGVIVWHSNPEMPKPNPRTPLRNKDGQPEALEPVTPGTPERREVCRGGAAASLALDVTAWVTAGCARGAPAGSAS